MDAELTQRWYICKFNKASESWLPVYSSEFVFEQMLSRQAIEVPRHGELYFTSETEADLFLLLDAEDLLNEKAVDLQVAKLSITQVADAELFSNNLNAMCNAYIVEHDKKNLEIGRTPVSLEDPEYFYED